MVKARSVCFVPKILPCSVVMAALGELSPVICDRKEGGRWTFLLFLLFLPYAWMSVREEEV